MSSNESPNQSFFAGQIFQNSRAVAEGHSGRDRYRRLLVVVWFLSWTTVFVLASSGTAGTPTKVYLSAVTLLTYTGVSFFAVWCLYALRWCSVERTVLNMYLALEILAALGLSLTMGLVIASFSGVGPLAEQAAQHLLINLKLMAATCAAQIAATAVKINWVTLLNQRSDLIQDREFFELVGRQMEAS